ncbi:hypothetical protein PTT_10893 [Pyrenophora teres f. teres 0-1]|uniref:Uncharacterized protein n=1 Tax=Pyrenophora teres f. teres (strain 0-1) TaxID=861557 RepID=E3RQB3_PYRTT|nr:hypothetical protein PTT_10893 [Pyrenophora teres f. teres 0-1]
MSPNNPSVWGFVPLKSGLRKARKENTTKSTCQAQTTDPQGLVGGMANANDGGGKDMETRKLKGSEK